MSDQDIADLVGYLAEHPDAGDEIQGTGGCRKLRFPIGGNNKGKSGGVRAITFFRRSEFAGFPADGVWQKSEGQFDEG